MSSLLSMPVSQALRTLALDYLHDAASACERFKKGTDDEALHDFRVALRRLRSMLRAYKPYMLDCISKKQQRRIKDLAASTGLARDTEVQIQWLLRQRPLAREHETPGFDWLQQRLEQRLQEEYEDLRVTLLPTFIRLQKRLQKRLTLDYDTKLPSFQTVTTGLLHTTAQELKQNLAAIHTTTDIERIHQARIVGKRLRYLMEPVAAEVDSYKQLVKELKILQDVMGEINDIGVFSHELREASEEAGARHMREIIELSLRLAHDDPQFEAALRHDARPGLICIAHTLQERLDDLGTRLVNQLQNGAMESFYNDLQRLL